MYGRHFKLFADQSWLFSPPMLGGQACLNWPETPRYMLQYLWNWPTADTERGPWTRSRTLAESNLPRAVHKDQNTEQVLIWRGGEWAGICRRRPELSDPHLCRVHQHINTPRRRKKWPSLRAFLVSGSKHIQGSTERCWLAQNTTGQFSG